MKNRTLLFIAHDTISEDDVRPVLQEAASQNARVVFLILAVGPAYPMNAFGAMPYGGIEISDQWLEALSQSKASLYSKAQSIRGLLQSEGVSGDVQVAHIVTTEVADLVARHALVSDLAYVAPSMRAVNADLFRAAVNGVLFRSEIGLALNGAPLARPNRVFVAWNTEAPAARAIHEALPVLKTAKEVIIASFDPESREEADGEDPGADVARWLSHHGCNVIVSQFPSGGGDIAAAIQRRAKELGVDLIVMGAYGRSRMREFVFGGTTRTMLEYTDTPILMAR